MFSKPKTDISPATEKPNADAPGAAPAQPMLSAANQKPAVASALPAKAKPEPSLFSQDLIVEGNVFTEGDIQIEGTVEGDVRASLVTVGETALVRGELCAEDVVVHGQVEGRLRGRKVRLASTARVEGDIVHHTIAIEAGARFEGSVQRDENPLPKDDRKPAMPVAEPAPMAGKKPDRVADISKAAATAAE